MNTKLFTDALSALLGQFTPGNLGSRLFMERSELETPENFLVWFHERFHYFFRRHFYCLFSLFYHSMFAFPFLFSSFSTSFS